jgi:hypothetical protein
MFVKFTICVIYLYDIDIILSNYIYNMSITNYTGTYQNYLGYLGAKKCCELRGLGPTGPRGATGPPGPIGIGLRGRDGVTGATGEQGPPGTMGLYCCYGTSTSTNETISENTAFVITMQGGSLLPGTTYAVNISIYLYGATNDITNPYMSFNLSNDPEVSGAPFYPQLYSSDDDTVYYLQSSGATSAPYAYTGSLTDYLYYNPTSNLQSPIINVYIGPTDTNRFKIKLVATIYPVSG